LPLRQRADADVRDKACSERMPTISAKMFIVCAPAGLIFPYRYNARSPER
jgi:hypothetical protein